MPVFHGSTVGFGVVIVTPATIGNTDDLWISNGDGTSKWADPAAWGSSYFDTLGDAALVQTNLDTHEADLANPHSVTASQAGAEPALGNPAQDGYVLSSTAAGTRSWIAVGGGVDPTADYDWSGTHSHTKTLHFKTLTPATPAANAVAVNLGDKNHHAIELDSATDSVTITLTAPAGATAGVLKLVQGTTARDVSWLAAPTGSVYWQTTEPTYTDEASSVRLISWFFDGNDIYLMSTSPVASNGGGGSPSVGPVNDIQLSDGAGGFAAAGVTIEAGNIVQTAGKQLTTDKIEATALADLIIKAVASGASVKLQTGNGINAIQVFGFNSARAVFGPGTDDGANNNQFYGTSGQSAVAAAFYTNSAGNVGARIKGFAGQTADRLQIVNSNDTAFFVVGPNNELYLFNLPTADPTVLGQVWSNAGVLTLSSG